MQRRAWFALLIVCAAILAGSLLLTPHGSADVTLQSLALPTLTPTLTHAGTATPSSTPTASPTPAGTGLLIQGTVRLGNAIGPGLPGVAIQWECEGSPDCGGETVTDASGRYQIGPLIPATAPLLFVLSATLHPYLLLPPQGNCIWYQGGYLVAQSDFVALSRTPTPTSIIHTATPTLTPPVSPTPTLTSNRPPPEPPLLVSPEDCALLSQPVPPNAWVFHWEGSMGPPAGFELWIEAPDGQHQSYSPSGCHFWGPCAYTVTLETQIAVDSLGPWYWLVEAHGTGGVGVSEKRRFWVVPPLNQIYLPLLLRGSPVAALAPDMHKVRPLLRADQRSP